MNVSSRSTKASAVFNNTISAFNNESKRKAVLANALSDLESFEAKYKTFEELSGVMQSIGEFKETMKE